MVQDVAGHTTEVTDFYSALGEDVPRLRPMPMPTYRYVRLIRLYYYEHRIRGA